MQRGEKDLATKWFLFYLPGVLAEKGRQAGKCEKSSFIQTINALNPGILRKHV